MQDRVLSHPNVEVHFNVSVDDVVGDAKGLTGLKIRHSESGAALAGASNSQFQSTHAFWADESCVSPSYISGALQSQRLERSNLRAHAIVRGTLGERH